MTSKIKVDNIENQCGGAVVTKCGATTTISGSVVKANDIQAADGGNIINQCGTTITLGASGDTINLASGASQTGFGRTGTVDWDTTAKTASFTAVSGNGYFVNTTSGAITVTLPASPSAGDIVAVADYAGTANTNNITIARNGSNIEGIADNGTISIYRESKTLVYVDATQGWVAVNDNADGLISPLFVTATGGTITTCGDFKIHTFTGPGTFTVCSVGNSAGSDTVSYLVVAGGGGGGDGRGGGGGGGGFREGKASSDCYTASPLNAPTGVPVTATGFPIVVGGGGAGASTGDDDGNPGNNSVFSTITSTGGGKGGGVNPSCSVKQGGPGGSGGGAGGTFGGPTAQPGGSGNTPPVSPPQGNNGGDGINNGPPNVPGCQSHGATGGGAGGAGSPATGTPAPGSGGVGVSSSITGSSLAYAGGAGGASDSGRTLGSSCGTGGDGQTTSTPAKNGTTNRGGGGGGVRVNQGGGSGGSGIVIIRYKYQ